jgi:hypothetical protein
MSQVENSLIFPIVAPMKNQPLSNIFKGPDGEIIINGVRPWSAYYNQWMGNQAGFPPNQLPANSKDGRSNTVSTDLIEAYIPPMNSQQYPRLTRKQVRKNINLLATGVTAPTKSQTFNSTPVNSQSTEKNNTAIASVGLALATAGLFVMMNRKS